MHTQCLNALHPPTVLVGIHLHLVLSLVYTAYTHGLACMHSKNYHKVYLIADCRISELDGGIVLTQPRLVAGITVTGVNVAPKQPQMARKRGRKKY